MLFKNLHDIWISIYEMELYPSEVAICARQFLMIFLTDVSSSLINKEVDISLDKAIDPSLNEMTQSKKDDDPYKFSRLSHLKPVFAISRKFPFIRELSHNYSW